MTTTNWSIPSSTLKWLEIIPTDRPVAMLIRHSVRGPLAEGDAGYHLPLTDDGHALALELGRHLRGHLRTAQASPLVRTMQTAERLLEGADLQQCVIPNTLLGDPGVYMLDQRAGSYWRDLGHERMMTHLVEDRPPLAGCAAADPAARFLVNQMLAQAQDVPGVHAYATHDSLVTATAARLLNRPLTRVHWPLYLEAAFFWHEGDAIEVAYRDLRGACPVPLVGLDEIDVVHLARREIAATVGLDCPARFFLAGEVFTALLTSKPPQNLDLWVPTSHDRVALEECLMKHGAEQLPDQPYSRNFRLNGRLIKLSLHVEPATLDECLLQCDIALSAVGVEYTPTDHCRAEIHPLAHNSVMQSQVLLLDGFKNWRDCLTSLERLRRYSSELRFAIPPGEEAKIWSIFDAQTPEMRHDMVERFLHMARHDQRVAEDLQTRGALG